MLARAARSLLGPYLALGAGSGAAFGASLGAGSARCAASNPNPPPDAARGATADLTDVFCPDPVDTVSAGPVQIMEAGLFR